MADLSIFRHWKMTDLKAMLSASITQSKANKGMIMVEYELDGRRARKEFIMSAEDFINAVNWALEYNDPDAYPPLTDRTRASFRSRAPFNATIDRPSNFQP